MRERLPLTIPTLLAALISGPVIAGTPTFDSSFLTDHSKKKDKKSETHSPAVRKNLNIEEPKDKESSGKVSFETIQSLTQLLKITPSGPRRNSLLLNRAAAMNLYARKMHLASGQAVMSENLKKFLRAAIRDAELVGSSPVKTPQQVERIHHLVGYAYVYLDEPKKALTHFIEILRLSPNSENAPWIALYIGEELYDQGKYSEAARFYSSYQGKMDAQGKELARYKLAWCKINLGATEEAENIFVEMAQTSTGQGLGHDAVKDLAYLLTHRANPESAIRDRENQFKKEADRIEFLNAVRANLETQNSVDLHAKTVLRLLELEKDPGKRLELLLADLRVRTKQYADHASTEAFDKLEHQVRAAGLKPDSAAIQDRIPQIENECIAIIRAFVDTYAGRTKTPEKFSREELENELKKLFRFFSEFVPESQHRSRIVGLWMDVCLDAADWAGLDEATEFVLSDQARLSTFAERAYIDQLTALEKLPAGDSKRLERKRQRMKEFVARFPLSVQWLRIARLFAQTEAEQGHDLDILPLLEKIHAREPTPDSYYRLQFSRFKAARFTQILGDPEITKFNPPEPRLAQLWRETCLVLAQAARKEDDLPTYERYIQKFLSLSPEESKSLIARQDYFGLLLDKGKEDDATRAFLSLGPQVREAPEMQNLRFRLWSASMKSAHFFEASKIASRPSGRKLDPDLAYRRVVAEQAMGRAPSPDLIFALSPQNRVYVLGVLSLLKPEAALDYFRAHAPSGDPERELAALAIRIHTGSWEIEANPERVSWLGSKFAFSQTGAGKTLSCEKKMNRVQFPNSKIKASALAAVVAKLVSDTRWVRSSVVKELQGKDPVVQLRVLEKARNLEGRVAQTILESPIPEELSTAQRDAYKKGLQDVASEFQSQSADFERTAAGLRERIALSNTERQSRILPAPEMKAWNWPGVLSDDSLRAVADAQHAGNSLGAFTLLDFFHEEHVKDTADYFRIRSGILLSSGQSEALRIYVRGELESAKQDEVINDWKKLTQGAEK